jgi:hypothetical protein
VSPQLRAWLNRPFWGEHLDERRCDQGSDK